MPIFRSRLQGEVLAAVLLPEDAELSLTELARRLGAPLSTVHREATRLESAGVVTSRRVGNTRFVRANRRSPAYAPLRQLVERYFGVPVVLGAEFGEVAAVDEVYIFGSWADRVAGQAGPEPNDIDVLVVGHPDRDLVDEAALRAERRLGKPVNVTVRSAEAWSQKADGFLQQVAASRLIPVVRDVEGGDDG